MQNDHDDALSLDEVRAELSDLGRALLDQAIASAGRAKQLRAELARATNSAHTPPDPAT